MREIEVAFYEKDLPEGIKDMGVDEIRKYLSSKAYELIEANAVIEYHYATETEDAKYVVVYHS